MKVVFACHTVYQIFIAYVIKMTEYQESDTCILMVEGRNNCDEIVRNAIQMKDWAKVSKIDARGMDNTAILNWLKEEDLCDLDILHLGSWGGKVANILSYHLKESAYSIIDEEGTASYSWLTIYEQSVARYFPGSHKKVNIGKIRKAYLFDPRISDNQLHIEEKRINIEGFMTLLQNQDTLDRMNFVFGYKDTMKFENIIFFDQNLYGQKVIGDDYQSFIIAQIGKVLGNNKMMLKQHPSENFKNKSEGIVNVDLMKNHGTPWEIIFINDVLRNHNYKDRIYITYCSSSVFNSMILGEKLEVNVKIILLYDMVNQFVRNKILLDKGVIDRYLTSYPEHTIKIPHSIKEMKMDICDCLGASEMGNENKSEMAEYEWLKKYYFDSFEKSFQQPGKPKYRFDLKNISGKVIVYGAGDVGQALFAELKKNQDIEIVAWCDKNYKRIEDTGLIVCSPEVIPTFENVKILIAVRGREIQEDIQDELRKQWLRNESIILWMPPL